MSSRIVLLNLYSLVLPNLTLLSGLYFRVWYNSLKSSSNSNSSNASSTSSTGYSYFSAILYITVISLMLRQTHIRSRNKSLAFCAIMPVSVAFKNGSVKSASAIMSNWQFFLGMKSYSHFSLLLSYSSGLMLFIRLGEALLYLPSSQIISAISSKNSPNSEMYFSSSGTLLDLYIFILKPSAKLCK